MEPKTPSYPHRPKQPPPPSSSHLARVFPVFLLSLLAATTLLNIPLPSCQLHPPVSGEDNVENSIKIHLSSGDQDRLLSQEEPAGSAKHHTFPCPDLIDRKANVTGAGKAILCCDRSHYRTDVCYMRGDVRTNSTSKSILLYNSDGDEATEKIRPYTRKWETPIMSTVDELALVPKPTAVGTSRCDVRHDVPGVIMSTGGYTGNVYHEFNDGLLPLFLTVDRFAGEVVLVILEYHQWWYDKYKTVVEQLTNYAIVDFRHDRRVHCFPEMIVGLRIHGELCIDPRVMPTGKNIWDFQAILNQAFGGGSERSTKALSHNQPEPLIRLPGRRHRTTGKPTIALFVRHGSRVLLNLRNVVRHCQKLGFHVQIIDPKRNTPLSQVYAVVNAADVMLAVHGAAVTHFIFMRPGSILMQIVPLGLDWAGDEYYGQPARKLGLTYMEYKGVDTLIWNNLQVMAEESSLSREYRRDDPVIVNPSAITQKGWQETKRIYLQHQNVTLDLKRFGKFLFRARSHLMR